MRLGMKQSVKRIILSMTLTSAVIFNGSGATELLPEVAAILNPSELDPLRLEGNIHAGMVGLNAPEADDFMAVGNAILLKTDQYKHDDKKHGDDYLGWTKQLNRDDFYSDSANALIFKKVTEDGELERSLIERYGLTVDQMLQSKEIITVLRHQNSSLIKRYESLQTYSYFDLYPYYSAFLVNYRNLQMLMNLQFADGIFALIEGDMDRGLTILTAEHTLLKKQMSGQSSILNHMMVLNQLHTLAQRMDELLDRTEIAPILDDPRFLALLMPLTNSEQQSINAAYYALFEEFIDSAPSYIASFEPLTELFNGMNWFQKVAYITGLNRSIGQHDYTVRSISNLFAISLEREIPLSYDLNSTLNHFYQLQNDTFYSAATDFHWDSALTPFEQPTESLYDALMKASKMNDELIDGVIEVFGEDNLYGDVIATELFFRQHYRSADTMYRFLDVATYQDLVYLKYRLKVNQIQESQINDYIDLSDSRYKTRLTEAPIIWDAKTRTLSTKWLVDEKKRGDLSEHYGLDSKASVRLLK